MMYNYMKKTAIVLVVAKQFIASNNQLYPDKFLEQGKEQISPGKQWWNTSTRNWSKNYSIY